MSVNYDIFTGGGCLKSSYLLPLSDVLLYPHHAGLGDAPSIARYTVAGCDDRLTVASVDVASHGAPRSGLAALMARLGIAA